MQSISILITSSPESPSACINAIKYCQAAATNNLAITQVFFYGAGVYHANGLIETGNKSANLPLQWAALSKEFDFPLLVCVGAATQRGIIDAEQAEQTGKTQYSLFPPFKQVGLGEFFTLLHDSDKLVQF